MMRAALSLLIGLLTAACTPLGAFNAVMPKDGGSRRIAEGAAYAAGPRGGIDLYAPTPRAEPLPLVVFFYGGSWNSGTREGYAFVGRALAAQGFLVAIPDYRLVADAPYPAFLQDCAAAVKWVRANARRHGGDPDRIILAGHSAGAYNAAMVALDPRWLGADRAAVRGFAGLAGPYDFLPLDTDVTRATFGGVADLPSTQPIRFAGPGDPPALLLAGGRDDLVRGANSRNLAAALSRAGVSAQERVYDGLGHVGMVTAIARPFRGKAPVLADLTAFARRRTALSPVPRSPSRR